MKNVKKIANEILFVTTAAKEISIYFGDRSQRDNAASVLKKNRIKFSLTLEGTPWKDEFRNMQRIFFPNVNEAKKAYKIMEDEAHYQSYYMDRTGF